MQWRKTKQRKGREHRAGLVGVSGSILSRRGGGAVTGTPPQRRQHVCKGSEVRCVPCTWENVTEKGMNA